MSRFWFVLLIICINSSILAQTIDKSSFEKVYQYPFGDKVGEITYNDHGPESWVPNLQYDPVTGSFFIRDGKIIQLDQSYHEIRRTSIPVFGPLIYFTFEGNYILASISDGISIFRNFSKVYTDSDLNKGGDLFRPVYLNNLNILVLHINESWAIYENIFCNDEVIRHKFESDSEIQEYFSHKYPQLSVNKGLLFLENYCLSTSIYDFLKVSGWIQADRICENQVLPVEDIHKIINNHRDNYYTFINQDINGNYYWERYNKVLVFDKNGYLIKKMTLEITDGYESFEVTSVDVYGNLVRLEGEVDRRSPIMLTIHRNNWDPLVDQKTGLSSQSSIQKNLSWGSFSYNINMIEKTETP
jgi:hypothetical protein